MHCKIPKKICKTRTSVSRLLPMFPLQMYKFVYPGVSTKLHYTFPTLHSIKVL